ncbi:MAG TPA: AbrB/MazE/SpoVT family DNA-binding domain-containing protein [Candidatus Thermoplasmatota archaeon]|nr:AbrB/MazE/SpoVT family DNA-binding domain-containing protein [Candidatus Thermoplasmatota archaeon]
MEIVTLDRLGRILLPKPLREEMHLAAGSRLLAVQAGGKLVLQPFDADELARRIAAELKGVDIEAIQKQVRKEAEREARRWYGAHAGRQRGGRRHQAPAAPDPKL